ncbi:PAS domain-containing protein [Colwelliaceae bacterium MEBiC 14330]
MLLENPQDFINNSSIGIHAVSADGIIIYANECELEVLGYTEAEYIGHHVTEFQMDKSILTDMMARLGKLEQLSNYPAVVKGKDEVKYIIYNSSVYEEDGVFKHTRCYGNEVAKPIYDVFYSHFIALKAKP